MCAGPGDIEQCNDEWMAQPFAMQGAIPHWALGSALWTLTWTPCMKASARPAPMSIRSARRDHGVREISVTDPEGHRWGFVQRLN